MLAFSTEAKLYNTSYKILLPGVSSDPRDLSHDALIDKNHRTHDIFHNPLGHINHLSHHYLAAYSFGASKERLQAIYDINAKPQRPLPPSVGTLNEDNYDQQLGNRDAYTSYLKFFKTEIDKRGMVDAIRYWTFLDGKENMLARVLGSAIHPLIHFGYAVEFNLPSIAAEGLAMAACSEDDLVHFTPAAARFYDNNNGTERIADIITKVKNDSTFKGVVKFTDKYKPVAVLGSFDVAAPKIREYVAQWNFQDPQKSLRELYTQVMLLFSTTGIRGKRAELDFFLAHCLTSIHATYTILPHFTPVQAESLLRCHLAMTLACYVACGSPALEPEVLANYKPIGGVNEEYSENPWFDVINRSILVMKDSHYIKVIRALVLGQVVFGEEEKKDPNSLWLKAAQVTLDVAEQSGENSGWNFSGIGFEETWNHKL
ncbi:hypothetical protein BDA99DRAFT_527654 [Phascolomyces articulosus]|uniref:Oxidoreductase AflY n=1 Tax=Phascolomyces articulosus TaxID=60185 RepID=A0AAD5JN06_9FUNG|nr:hypothetical protein BDA99DRAFT_527654 [Phascolomyces articulosus]